MTINCITARRSSDPNRSRWSGSACHSFGEPFASRTKFIYTYSTLTPFVSRHFPISCRSSINWVSHAPTGSQRVPSHSHIWSTKRPNCVESTRRRWNLSNRLKAIRRWYLFRNRFAFYNERERTQASHCISVAIEFNIHSFDWLRPSHNRPINFVHNGGTCN